MAERCPTCGGPMTDRFAAIVRTALEGQPTPERLVALETVAQLARMTLDAAGGSEAEFDAFCELGEALAGLEGTDE